MNESNTPILESSPVREPRIIVRPRPVLAIVFWFGRTLPTLLVLLALGGLAAWGHHTGWTLPKFSALTGNGPEEKKDWCEAHDVPESLCVECNPDLLPRPKAPPYCKKHGVPECPVDYPQVAEVNGKHQLPRYDTLAALALLDRPENNRQCKTHERRIQFASAAAARKAGVDDDVVSEEHLTEYLAAHGEVGYDQTRVARLSSRVPGTVWWVAKQVGDPVQQGELLALVDAAEVGKAKAEFLQSFVQVGLRQKTWENYHRAATSGAVPDRQLREAETALSEARIRLLAAQQALTNLGLPVTDDEVKGLTEEQLAAHLRVLGLPASVTERLDAKRTTANLFPLTAPLDGVVVAREGVAGEGVDAAKPLFVVADPSRMWLTLSVRQEDTRHLKLGQPVRFTPAGGDEVTGNVSWISTAVDEKTRTVKVRATLPNPDGRLRANAFGSGRIILRDEPYAVAVRNEAIHWDGDCHVVFVRDRNYNPQDPDSLVVYHVRKVRLGARDGDYTELLAGVLPGEVVARKGSAVLEAQLLKSKLGEA